MVGTLPVPLSDLRLVQDVEFTVEGLREFEGHRPYPFQKIGAGAIVFTPRMVLADETGLGKTLSVLMALKVLKDRGLIRRVLWVTKRVLLHQWVTEAEDWLPGSFRSIIVEGDKAPRRARYRDIARSDGHPLRHHDVVLLSYSTARVDSAQLLGLDYDMVVMDEASAIRNPEAEQTQRVTAICQKPGVARVVAVTATPVQARLEEYHSIFQAVDATVLGTREAFEARYCIVDRFQIERRWGPVEIRNIVGYRNLPDFRAAIRHHVLQRTIEDVGAQMPELVIQDRWLDLTDEQQRRYDEMEDGVLALEGQEDREQEAMQRVVRLSQVCDALPLIYPDASRLPKEAIRQSCKLAELDDLLRNDLRGQPVVLFSKYVEMLELARETVLDPLKIVYGTVYGGQDAAWTEAQRQRFQAGELQVMLMSTAGEEGLNLGAGKYLICLDSLYNEGRMRQIYARIRRLSSVHPQAIIIRLLCRNTLEERVIQLLQKRAALIDYMDSRFDLLDQLQMQDVMRVINRRVNLLD